MINTSLLKKITQVSLIALLAATNVTYASSDGVLPFAETDLYPGETASSRSLEDRYSDLHGLGKDTDFEIKSTEQLDRLDNLSRFFAARGLEVAKSNLAQLMELRINFLETNSLLVTPDQTILFWEKILDTLKERDAKDQALGVSYDSIYMPVHHNLGYAHFTWMTEIGMLPIAVKGKTDHCKKAVEHLLRSNELGAPEEANTFLDQARYFLGVALFNDAKKLTSSERAQKLVLFQESLAILEDVKNKTLSAREQYPSVKAAVEQLLKEIDRSTTEEASTAASSAS